MGTALDVLEPLFIAPEKTASGYSFADIPIKISFSGCNVVSYGIPLDITTSFGKGTARGPECIRVTSARQIETFIFDQQCDIYERAKIYDIGDLSISSYLERGIEPTLSYLDQAVPKVNSTLHNAGKIPVIFGGEHTLSFYSIKTFSSEDPLIIHFDAHRDLKPVYEGLEICHTTPFYQLIKKNFIPGENLIQIGVRQSDKEENQIAIENGVVTFDAWSVHRDMEKLLNYIKAYTANRRIYISFDIDVYDLPYVPCTGTPEPFGLDPFDVQKIINAISPSAELLGLDMVEVSLRNNDYREGTLATQTLYRLLSAPFI